MSQMTQRALERGAAAVTLGLSVLQVLGLGQDIAHIAAKGGDWQRILIAPGRTLGGARPMRRPPADRQWPTLANAMDVSRQEQDRMSREFRLAL
ncbi:hypothetical protein [Pseudomonas sp. MF6768]|uniref:hypothetical protein n=1 Tax=Pseudomonas sp. MF6768 TaxID=2797532 RepID=UPI0018E86B74|nr:hypothetical protein [Pseudomonas sp. MF6768]MBJ2241830.1 hypothetical protein [Pseudomonas sp. MF6768]